MIKIDTDVPAPVNGQGRVSSETKEACEKMNVNDSFVIPSYMSNARQRSIASCMNDALFPKRFMVRKQTDGTRRLWRIA